MQDYWRKFRARTYIIVTAIQTSVLLLLLLALELLGVLHLSLLSFFAIAFTMAAIFNGVSITLIHFIGRPFRDLVQAIVLISSETSTAAPPNPNVHTYDRDGFKEILQTVYQFGTKDNTAVEPANTFDTAIKDGLDMMPAGVIIFDKEQKIIYHNLLAPIRKNIDNEDTLELTFPESDSFEQWLAKVAANKISAEHSWQRISNKLPGEKGRRVFDVTVSYRKNSNAETVMILLDRTSTYMPEEDDLDFISFAAHELRGPITVIRGYLDVLNDELGPVLENDQAELMQRLVVTANRLTSYVNNILNASRYDRRHLQLHLSEESVGRIYSSIADDMEMRAKSQNRLLVTDIPKELPTVAADSAAISEVMGNLIDNAIKYSNEGGLVHVTARTIPGFVEISVIDRGIGMPSSVLPNLFHKFYRSHRSRETVAGTGIGLYICKAIVGSHGGTIDVRSIENEGSTFSFTLPIYDTVAAQLQASRGSNASLIEHGNGWIRNHNMLRG
jgi:signal transduction histidine kinase